MSEGKLMIENRDLALSTLEHWEQQGMTEEFLLKYIDAEMRDNIFFSIIDAVTQEEGIRLMDKHPLMKTMFCDYSLKRGVFTKSFQNKLREQRGEEGAVAFMQELHEKVPFRQWMRQRKNRSMTSRAIPAGHVPAPSSDALKSSGYLVKVKNRKR